MPDVVDGPLRQGRSLFKPAYAADRVLVRFRSGKSVGARAVAHAAVGGQVRRRFKSVRDLEVIELPAGSSVFEAVRRYKQDPDVLYAEPDYLLYPLDTLPNDPAFDLLWGLHNNGAQGGVMGADIHAPQAWSLTTGSSNVVVGVIDTGVDTTHNDLVPNLFRNEADCNANGVDDDGNGVPDDCYGITTERFTTGNLYDDVGHGTHVNGTIGAVGNNNLGVVGVNWNVKIINCKFLGIYGGETSKAIACLDYMAMMKDRGVPIVATNNSWGGWFFSQALQDAIQGNMERGILFIAAAGNGGYDGFGDNNDGEPNYPSNYPLANLVGVAASDRTDRLAYFSNYGPHSVHLAAPGVSILSTYPVLWGGYNTYSGTSMAAPHVTGTAALLQAYDPALDWKQIRNLLIAGTDPVTAMQGKTITGGRLNAYRSMTCTNRPVSARLRPKSPITSAVVGEQVVLAMLNINCDRAAGPVSVTLNPGGAVLPLHDDGATGDAVADDGIYTALWQPTSPGTYTISFANGEQVTVLVLRAYNFSTAPCSYRTISGTSLDLSDDSSVAVNLPFPLLFGDSTFSKFYVSSNGLISFDRPYSFSSGLLIPYPDTPAVVAPYWDDLMPVEGSSSNVYWAVQGTAPQRELVVEWRNVAHYGVSGGGVTFQVVFFENSSDVLFNYADVTFNDAGHAANEGGQASIGIQTSPTDGTPFSYYSAAVRPGTALLWQITGPDFRVAVDPKQRTVYPGQSAKYDVKVTAVHGFSGEVTVRCGTGAPATCQGGTLLPTPTGAVLQVQASDTVAKVYAFDLVISPVAEPADEVRVGVTLRVVDFKLGPLSPTSVSVPDGETSPTVAFPLKAEGSFEDVITLSCNGLPAGATCSFSPSSTVTLTPGAAVDGAVAIQLAAKTAPGDYPITVLGSAKSPSTTRSDLLQLTVTAKPDFLLSGPEMVQSLPGQPVDAPITIDVQDGYNGAVQISCSVAPEGATCAIGSLPATPGQVTLHLEPGVSNIANYVITVTGTDGTRTHSITLSYAMTGYTIVPPANAIAYSSYNNSIPFQVVPINDYRGTVRFSCEAAWLGIYNCWLGWSQVNFSQIPGPLTNDLRFYGPASVVQGTYPILIRSEDTATGLVRLDTVMVSIRGFTLRTGENVERTILVGDTSLPFDLVLTPYGGYNLPTELAPGSFVWNTVTFAPSATITPGADPVPVTFTVRMDVDLHNSRGGKYGFAISGRAKPEANSGYEIRVATEKSYILNVQDFALKTDFVSPKRALLVPGSAVEIPVTNVEYSGLNVPVDVSCPNDLPTGYTCTVSRTPLLPDEVAIVTVSAPPEALDSYRYLGIIGHAQANGRDLVHETTVPLTIGTFKPTLSPPVVSLLPDGSQDFVLTIEGPSAYSYSVTLDCPDLDPGFSCEFSRNPVYVGETLGVTMRTTAGVTTAGTHTFTVTATREGVSRSGTATVIMEGPNGIQVTAPNGGEMWAGGSTQRITWNYAGDPGPAKLELLKKGIAQQTIATGIPAGSNGSGSYSWAIPVGLPFSADYTVRVSGASDPSATDTSDMPVWIGNGFQILRPNGGDFIQKGDYVYAGYTWGGNVTGAKVELLKGSTVIALLDDNAPAAYSNGGPVWTSRHGYTNDLQEGNNYKIRMTSLTDPSQVDLSDGPFTIGTRGITITSPAAGDVWLPGSTHTITWTYKDVPDNFDVNISLDNHGSIVASVPIGANGQGFFTWTVPPGFEARNDYILVVATNPAALYAVGRVSPLTIGDYKRISLTKTGTGTDWSWVKSDPAGISCFVSCTQQVATFPTGSAVTLTADPGGNIFEGWSGACSGTLPCHLIMDSDYVVGAALSNPNPNLQVTAPQAGDTYVAGIPKAITWNWANNAGSTVKIDLYKGGLFLYTITPNAPIGPSGAGSFLWNVSPIQPSGSDYSARVTANYAWNSSDRFTVVGPSVKVTSPNGGELWQPGSTQTIRWTTAGSIGTYVRIELYADGVLATTVAAAANAAAGAYTWTVPAGQLQSTAYTVKITSTAKPTISDESDEYFTISTMSVQVTSPNGGEILWPGTTHPISWMSTGLAGTTLKIELLKGGRVAALLSDSAPAGDGSLNWAIPALQARGSDYRIRITSNQFEAAGDSSNADFTIDKLYALRVLKAGAGAGVVTSSPEGIDCGPACSAGFAVSSSVTLTAIPDSGHIFSGWSAPCQDPGSATCIVVMDADWTVTATFAPPPTSIALTSPNGGETLNPGANLIRWNYTGTPGTAVRIELLRGGSLFQTLAVGAPMGSNGAGSLNWTVPSTIALGLNYRLRVTSTTKPDVTDTSDADFRVNGTGIQVVSPNGGESWRIGQPQTIRWIYGGSVGTAVRVDLYKAGVLNRMLAASTPIGSANQGQFTWTVPATQVLGSDYKIRVASTANASYNDQSDGNFSITNTSLTLTSPNGGELWRPGTSQTVAWTYSGSPGTDVLLELLQNGSVVAVLEPSTSIGANGSGAANVMVPNVASGANFTVRITSNQDLAYSDVSNAPFTVDDKYRFTVTQAGSNGGHGTITSSPPGLNCTISSCSVMLGPAGAQVSFTAVPDATEGGHTFTGWGGACASFGTNPVCTLTANADQALSANFAGPAPSVTLTSPNGAETWSPGAHIISWTYTGAVSVLGSAVKIELLRGGNLAQTISSSAPLGSSGAGSFNWTVLSTLALGTNYRIRVTSTTRPDVTDTSDADFRINGRGIEVVSPNGGESWQIGQPQTVKWIYGGSVGTAVRVDLYKAGVLNRTLITSTPIGSANQGQYTWTVPATQVLGSDYRIRVASTLSASYNDQSDGNFSITNTSLTVTSPNGGELWRPGSAHNITWAASGSPGTDLRVELLRGGVLDSVIAASVPVAAGAYAWTIPPEQQHASGYAVRITSNQGSWNDSSNTTFTIDDLYQVSVAKTGTGLGTVSSQPAGINCGSSCVANFSAGASVTLTATPNAGHTFTGWSGACTGNEPCVLTIDSDKSVTASFTAPPTGITLAAPNGGESWNAGTLQTVRWTYSGSVGTAVRIELYKGGVLTRVLSAGAPIGNSGAGSFNWTIAATQASGNDYTVRVASTANAAYSDVSDAPFRINGPGVTLTAPNGGETFQPGTNQIIRWTYAGSVGTAVRIELYKAGVLNRTLSTTAPIGSGGNGSFTWAVASTQALGADYKVKITSTSNASFNDQSDGFFSIGSDRIKVTSPNGRELWRPGSSQTVGWTYSGAAGTEVKIELLKAGAAQALIAAAAPIGNGGAGSYAWSVPPDQAHGSDYAIRVTSNQNTLLSDSSDANFTIDELYQLSVSKQGTGSGTVSSAPAGISCGAACSASFSQGSQVVLTATPLPGHTFEGWSGACSGAGACTVTINGDTAVTATFSYSAPASSLTVLAPDGGETLLLSEITSIRWSYSGAVGTAVKVELLNNGVLSRVLAAAAPVGANGVGSLSWKVSGSQPVGDHYRIRITSTTAPEATDTSNADFSIQSEVI